MDPFFVLKSLLINGDYIHRGISSYEPILWRGATMKKYPVAMMLIHWLTLLLVVAAYATSGDPTRGHNPLDFLLGQIHVLTGCLLFILVLARLVVRFISPLPPVTNTATVLAAAAKAGHGLLYLFMLLTPLAGWCKLSSKVSDFDAILFSPPLLAQPSPWLHQLGNAHETIGNLFITLVGLHAVAALVHHYYFKDETLKKMLPH